MTKKKSSRRVKGTGTIFRRGGKWVGRVIIGRRADNSPRYAERRADTQSELLKKLDAIRPPGSDVTLAAWARRWLDADDTRPNTRSARKTSVEKHITPVLGAVRVAELTAFRVEEAARTWRAAGLAPNTVRLVLAHLHTCLGAAVRAGLRPDNPVRTARKPRGERTRIDPFSPAELAAIIAEAAGRPATRVITLLAATGCRAGEALALEAGDYDPDAGTISITKTLHKTGHVGPPKSPNSVRTISVPAAALPALRDALGGREEGPLFPTASGARGSIPVTRAAWQGVCRRLGLRFRNVHVLRHSCISALVAAGVPVADVARYAGDSVATIVANYVHATNANPVGVLNALFGAPAGGGKVGAAPGSGAKRRES